MRSRRKWDLGVQAGLGLCCALFFCAAAARADNTAETSVAANESLAATTASSADSLKAGSPPPKGEAEATPKPDIPSGDDLKQRSGGVEHGLIDDPGSTEEDADSDFTWLSLVAPLAVVLLVICLVFWAVRKYVPGMRRLAGSSAVRVLARTYLSPRQSVTLVKVGRRVLVVGQSADRLSGLGEISDGEEVSELLGLCRSEGDHSVSKNFQKIFREADREYDEGGEAVVESPDTTLRSSASLRSTRQLGRVRSQLDDLARKVREVVGLKR